MEKDWKNLAENFNNLRRLVTGDEIDKSIKFELSQLKCLGNLLEFGCGNGDYTKSLVENSVSILASDILEDMVRVATEELKNFTNVKVQQMDCYDADLEPMSYDTIFMGNLIHVVSKPDVVIAEAHRILKDKGKLIIVSFTKDGLTLEEIKQLKSRYIKYLGQPPESGTSFSLDTLTNFITANNFEVCEAKLLGEKMSKAIFLIAQKK